MQHSSGRPTKTAGNGTQGDYDSRAAEDRDHCSWLVNATKCDGDYTQSSRGVLLCLDALLKHDETGNQERRFVLRSGLREKRDDNNGGMMPESTSATRRRHRTRFTTGSGGKTLAPTDPIVSVYPLPMDAKRAKDETVRARRLGKKLPLGHPYRRLPLWVPYWLARLINNSAPSSKPTQTEKDPG